MQRRCLIPTITFNYLTYTILHHGSSQLFFAFPQNCVFILECHFIKQFRASNFDSRFASNPIYTAISKGPWNTREGVSKLIGIVLLRHNKSVETYIFCLKLCEPLQPIIKFISCFRNSHFIIVTVSKYNKQIGVYNLSPSDLDQTNQARLIYIT